MLLSFISILVFDSIYFHSTKYITTIEWINDTYRKIRDGSGFGKRFTLSFINSNEIRCGRVFCIYYFVFEDPYTFFPSTWNSSYARRHCHLIYFFRIVFFFLCIVFTYVVIIYNVERLCSYAAGVGGGCDDAGGVMRCCSACRCRSINNNIWSHFVCLCFVFVFIVVVLLKFIELDHSIDISLLTVCVRPGGLGTFAYLLSIFDWNFWATLFYQH